MLLLVGICCLLFGIAIIFAVKAFYIVKPKNIRGFWNISSPDGIEFIPLSKEVRNIATLAADTSLFAEVPRQWHRIVLSQNERGVFIEDRNYKDYSLKNRKRLRRGQLYHEDILDFGSLSLMYHDPASSKQSVIRGRGQLSVKGRGNTLELTNTPVLQPSDPKRKLFWIDKNVIYIGRSPSNDIALRSPLVAQHHAKILFVSGRAKLVNLAKNGNTFVNGKRIEERYLTHKDEVSFDIQKFRFLQHGLNNEPSKTRLAKRNYPHKKSPAVTATESK